MYGIWRAGRSASTEALILTAPAFLNEGGCNYALTLLLSLAKYFSSECWKPIIHINQFLSRKKLLEQRLSILSHYTW